MLGLNTVVVALSALNLVSATTSFTIDPSEVALSTRASWCQSQENICNDLCGQDTSANDCSTTTLGYSCTCSNGTSPDCSNYLNSMQYYICEQAQADCITANENNAQGQANCTKTYANNCGALDASKADTSGSTNTASAGTATAAATGAATATASSGTASSTSSSSGGAAVATNIQHLGNGAAAVALGLFAYML